MEETKETGIVLNMPSIKSSVKIASYAAILIGIIYLGQKNYLLFHSISELFAIIIAFTMTIISANIYKISEQSLYNRIIFLGMAYGFVAFFDLIHTLSYEGMGVFPNCGSNLPTQLWIVARYMESISLLIALKFHDKRYNIKCMVVIYSVISACLMLSIFNWGIFPDCYIDGYGLTPFKIVSEYVVSVILIIAIFYLIRENNKHLNKMNKFLLLSLVTTVISEMLFIVYAEVYDLSNLMGHIFKLISFYSVYIALVESSLKGPHFEQIRLNKLLNEKNQALEDAIKQLKLEYEKREEMEELQRKMEIKHALLEKTKEMDELKTNFFCTISHELKTPVNIILGSIQLLASVHKDKVSCPLFQSSKKYSVIMKQNCNRLIKLVNNLVDITKIDSGFMQLNLNNQNIISIIEDITLSVAEYVKSKNITLIFDTETEERIIACDAYKLERVMLNLLSNAVKFTEYGGYIWVNICDKRDSIVISVKDTGIGIPENMLEEVFDRFRQVDSSLRREREGSGIGLSLVKSMVELHGGEISLNSVVGKGSEFIIELPARLTEESNECSEISVKRESSVEWIDIEFSDIYDC